MAGGYPDKRSYKCRLGVVSKVELDCLLETLGKRARPEEYYE